MRYIINNRTGEVHDVVCASSRRVRPSNLSVWDPAKAHLTPGVTPCPTCLPDGLPPAGRRVRVLEDPAGTPYPEEVQVFLRRERLAGNIVDQPQLVAALESVAWHAWEDGNGEGQRLDRGDSANPHAIPEMER